MSDNTIVTYLSNFVLSGLIILVARQFGIEYALGLLSYLILSNAIVVEIKGDTNDNN